MSFDIDSFEAAKRASVAQLLFKCARLLNEQGVARLRTKAGQPQLRAAHMTLFPHIAYSGTRATEIADKLGISKQAVGQLVGELVAMGALEQVPDPSDGRAKLIRFSTAGQMGLSEGLKVLADLEKDLEKRIGKHLMRQLHQALLAVEEVLTEQEAT